jgi:hypothetical protein
MGEWSYSPTIPHFGTGWRSVFSFTPRPLYTRGWTSGTHWIAGWMGPKTGLDAVDYRKILCPCRELNPSRHTRSPSLYRLSYSGSFGYISTTWVITGYSRATLLQRVNYSIGTLVCFHFSLPAFQKSTSISVCMCFCNPFQIFNHKIDFYEMWYERCAIENKPNL